MEIMYLCIVVFLLCLAVFDLFVGVSNDAVNFLQSAVGARVASYKTIVIIASVGVILGAVMSSGMMDVARHGIMTPSQYSFEEVITIFLAVMVTDVIILDIFNTLGMPTSTTVSLVFELLGGTFVIACIKLLHDDNATFSDLMNTEQALKVIIAIFVSVAIAFVFGVIVMWLSRIIFTFNHKLHSRYSIALFGGIAFTALSYFIFMKGLGKSPYLPDNIREFIDVNIKSLLFGTFIVSTLVMEVLYLLRVNIFKFVVLMGTFALAMAFAGNDLVNFIGVPLAGLDTYKDFATNGNGVAASGFMMTSLMESASTTPIWLLSAGIIMIIAMATSKKAQNVIKTSVDLSRQDEGDEMFGSSRAARAIVRLSQTTNSSLSGLIPARIVNWIDSRFKEKAQDAPTDVAFDVVRAAVNLVLASMLITIGTNLKLPLSTTYVTFMVAMGSSLADRAWGRESAVFRVTGVLSVIGGWFITAGAAFLLSGVVCLIMFYGGILAQMGFMALVVFLLIDSNRKYKKKMLAEGSDSTFRLMMRTRDPELVWDMLQRQVSRTQSFVCHFSLEKFNVIVDSFADENLRSLKKSAKELQTEARILKKFSKQEMIALKHCPVDTAIERNTWLHVGANSNKQFIYCLGRMLEPILEHISNGFNPLPHELLEEFRPVQGQVNELMKRSEALMSTGRYDTYRDVLSDATQLKRTLSVMRKRHIDRMQRAHGNADFQVSVVYLNLLQETHQFLSNMRHQLRATKRFTVQSNYLTMG